MIAASKAFSVLALAGFIASLIAHLYGYVGIDQPFGIDPWPLHIGVFVVWLPAVLAAQSLSKDFPQKDMWKATLRGCPKWMVYTLYGLFGYAFLSIFGSILPIGRSEGGATLVRGFSGHWLLFYFAAYAILFSYSTVALQGTVRRCSKAHVVEPSDEYCRQCGERVDQQL